MLQVMGHMGGQSFLIGGVVDHAPVEDPTLIHIQTTLIRCNYIFLKEKGHEFGRGGCVVMCRGS